MSLFDDYPQDSGDIIFGSPYYEGLPPLPANSGIFKRPWLIISGQKYLLDDEFISSGDFLNIAKMYQMSGVDNISASSVNTMRKYFESNDIMIGRGGLYPHLRTHGCYEYPVTWVPTELACWWDENANNPYFYIKPTRDIRVLPGGDWTHGYGAAIGGAQELVQPIPLPPIVDGKNNPDGYVYIPNLSDEFDENRQYKRLIGSSM